MEKSEVRGQRSGVVAAVLSRRAVVATALRAVILLSVLCRLTSGFGATEALVMDPVTHKIKNPIVNFGIGNTLNVTGANLIGFTGGGVVDGQQIFDGQSPHKLAADFGVRQLYDTDGTTVAMDWSFANGLGGPEGTVAIGNYKHQFLSNGGFSLGGVIDYTGTSIAFGRTITNTVANGRTYGIDITCSDPTTEGYHVYADANYSIGVYSETGANLTAPATAFFGFTRNIGDLLINLKNHLDNVVFQVADDGMILGNGAGLTNLYGVTLGAGQSVRRNAGDTAYEAFTPGGGIATDGIWDALGDLVYGSADNAGAKLAGNTSTTRKFLRQVGNGTISAAPLWDILLAGDIPDLSATYQPLAATLTSWGGVSRGTGFDTFAATPSSANLRALLTDENGTGAVLFNSASGVSLNFTQTGLTLNGGDTNAVTLKINETETAARTLNVKLNNTDRTIDLSGNLTFLHSITLDSDGTGTRTLNIGAGGTLGSAAFTSSASYEVPLTFTNSLVRTTNSVALDGDAASPGNTRYYGTNGSGTKGYFAFPSTTSIPEGTNLYYTDARVDARINNYDGKPSVAYASTTALPANNYANGSSGVGATLTGSSNGPLIIDSVTLVVGAAGQRVLVAGEAAPANDGWYTITQVGVVAVSPYILTRATESDQAAEIGAGYLTSVIAPNSLTPGSGNNGKVFISVAADPFTVGTTSLTFSQIGGVYAAGNGISLSGSTFSINTGVTVDKTTAQALTNKDMTGAGNTFPTFNQNTTGNAATVTTNANLTGPITSSGNAATVAYGMRHTFFVENPSAAESVIGPKFANAATITKVSAVLAGSATPSVTYNTGYGTNATSLTNVTTSPVAVTSTTTGTDATLNNTAIPAGGWLVLSTSAQSGTVLSLTVTVEYSVP